jgi:single-stranded-DNA-specific exonuclease
MPRPKPGPTKKKSNLPGTGLPWVRPEWEPLPEYDPASVSDLERALNLPRALCALLVVRGHEAPERAKAFLRPRLDGLTSAHDLADGDRAAERLGAALRAGETIFVHGDYDVDGVSGVSLLTRWMRELGGSVVPFVPNRSSDGYDLGPAGVRAAVRASATVLLTTDCGIRAHDAVAEATRQGLDVIVTDHHTPGEELPDAYAVVNPNRADCAYPNKALCGAGVAYQICRLLAEDFGREERELYPLLDLVALATVADLVPLTGENRALVRFGLRAMAQTRNLGLRALMKQADVSGEIAAGQVGFRLGPRINAVGRMADANTAVELLLTESPERATELATVLDDHNRARQDEERRTLDAALAWLDANFDADRDLGLVVDGEGWHPGVIGIVASRIVERVHRPTVLIARNGRGGRGSARSISGFDLLQAIEACREFLDRFGGHKQAAGMDVSVDRIDAFRKAFNSEVNRVLPGGLPRPILRPDIELSLSEATHELMKYLPYLGPFGMGNPGPTFVARGVRLTEPARIVGKGHLKVGLEQDGTRLDGIGFGLGQRVTPESLKDGPFDVLFKLTVNEWRGRRRIEVHLRDIRQADEQA